MSTRTLTILTEGIPSDTQIQSYCESISDINYYIRVTPPDIQELSSLIKQTTPVIPAKSPQGKSYLNTILSEIQYEESCLYQELKVFLNTVPEYKLIKINKSDIYVPEQDRKTRKLPGATLYVEQYPIQSFQVILDQLANLHTNRFYTTDLTEITSWYDIVKFIALYEHPHILILKGSTTETSIIDPSTKVLISA
ncbi:hypothetical protein [Bacteroides sp.]|uniref:hypothetical protein n=1 Tax=Bacteroides sp. TaxID=29523 RepID=UPI00261F291D|nr:hypothetical protein [Bacteroides sp.]MDD3040710.1 hypothetical protein [Bacteroides sp.]